MRKVSNIQKSSPKSGVTSPIFLFFLQFLYQLTLPTANRYWQSIFLPYTNSIRKHTTIAKNATPSISAAATIMFERMSPTASG
jgi:hypothetical protein